MNEDIFGDLVGLDFPLTQDMINKGEPCCNGTCPVALAMVNGSRTYGFPSFDYIWRVSSLAVKLHKGIEEHDYMLMSNELAGLVMSFDMTNGGEMGKNKMKPCTLSIREVGYDDDAIAEAFGIETASLLNDLVLRRISGYQKLHKGSDGFYMLYIKE